MRPPISLPTARTLLSVRYASTASEGSASSLASAYGKGSTARARQQQSAPSSFQQRNEDQSDDFDASVGGMAEESSNLDDGGARALPLFKYHGNWGVPKTPGLRHLKMPYSPWLWPGRPFKALTIAARKNGGRGETGRIVRRHIGGGHKRRHRLLDFHRLEGGPQDVVRVEYDPGRSAHICLLRSRTGLGPHGGWSYVVAPDGVRAGDVLTSYRDGIPKGLVPQWDEEVEARVKEAAKEKADAKALKALARQMQELGSPKESGLLVEGAEVTKGLSKSDQTVLSSHLTTTASSSIQPSQRSFSISPTSTVQLSQISNPSKPKAPSIIPARLNPSYTQSPTHGTNPSFALNLLRSLVVKPGNVLQIALIPVGQSIHNITLTPTGRMSLCRSAGTVATILSHQRPDEKNKVYSFIKLHSGEVRKVLSDGFATIGQVSNKYHGQRNLGKAGRSRWLGRRPRVRGVAMNAMDHPHGGGRGKSKSNTHPKSIYGWLTRGVRTRKPGVNGHKNGNRMVVKERPRGKQTPALMQRKQK